jgi:chemotaxis protein MotB
MAYARRSRSNPDIWPGFVDALASLLMVIIFLLMIFVVSQLFLNEELIGRDKALDQLQGRLSTLSDMLALERENAADLKTNLSSVKDQLRASLAEQDVLEAQIFQLRGDNATLTSELSAAKVQNQDLTQKLSLSDEYGSKLEQSLGDADRQLDQAKAQISSIEQERQKVSSDLEEAYKIIAADKEKISAQLGELARLDHEIKALIALRDDLQGRLAEEALALDSSQKDLIAAQAEAALLGDHLVALSDQISELNALLETYEARDSSQQTQIIDLGKRLNVALAGKVQELAQYRSEFFGKLRTILGNRDDIRIVGDRFIFQSEVLFDKGNAELGPAGRGQLNDFANTLSEISTRIPAEVDWILQVDGHTDKDPIHTALFPSNWELSAARAISVVRYLESRGIDPGRLAAAGYAANQPLDPGDTPEALTRNRRIEMKFTSR